ncbi:hypothetical protein LSAT2_009687 [Lamellibrachia satsuma]|nr:hypothetical protein LSAT2_009687 [Lamellibrachia satsuma]
MQIVAPYGGRLRKTGSRQITISVGNMKNVEIIIDNVELNVEEKEVAAGEAVGRGVTPQWCSDTHIHVAMVKTGTVEEIDPTGYLRKRNMPLPEWVQNCNHYILHWKVFVTSQGNFMGSSKESDTTPAVSRPTEDLNIDAIEESDRKKRGLSDFLDTVNDFGQSLGLPNLLALKDVLNFNMNSIRLKTVFDFLGDTTQQKLKSTINKVLKEVERVTNQQDCNNPATMDDTELKQALVMRGLSVIGARQTLVNRYLKSDPHCLDIGNQVGPNVYCRFDETCTSISCCINLKLFIYRHSLKAFIRYDPCDMELRLGFNAWTTSYSVVDENFGIEETVDISGELNALNVVPLHLKLKIQRTSNAIKVSMFLAGTSV